MPSAQGQPSSAAVQAASSFPLSCKIISAICIAANSLTAGSIFCFPLFGPSLTRDLGLSLTETNTIWVGAVLGEYLGAAPWGAIADMYGPKLLCVAASILFASGYGLMAHADKTAADLLAKYPHADAISNGWRAPGSFVWMALYFVCVGLGVSASYFSAVTASTQTFPSHPGLAIALPLTLFSLSSLFLSAIGGTFFIDSSSGDLDTPAFLTFLAILLGAVNLLSAFGLRSPPPPPPLSSPIAEVAQGRPDDPEAARVEEPTEHTALLGEASSVAEVQSTSGSPVAAAHIPGVPSVSTLSSFLRTPASWALAIALFASVGGAEMVMSSVGSMVVSLLGPGSVHPAAFAAPVCFARFDLGNLAIRAAQDLPKTAAGVGPGLGSKALAIRRAQVQLLATANTISRLLAGLLSDLLSPSRPLPASTSNTDDVADPNHRPGHKASGSLRSTLSRIRVSRLTIILATMIGLLVAFLYAAFGLRDTDGLVLVSLLTGIGYGFVFTLVPAIVAQSFGLSIFGRAWGLLSYACAAGSLTYSLLYASVSDRVAASHPHSASASVMAAAEGSKQPQPQGNGNGTCLIGSQCFAPSFIVASIGMLLAILVILPLWKSWRRYL